MINISAISFDYSFSSITNDELNDIFTCLKTLYTTKEGTQPLDREFGINTDFLSKPVPVAESIFTVEIMNKTDKYEQRVIVSNVTFTSKDGTLSPIIHLERREDSEY